MTFEELRKLLMYRRIATWNENTIVLDNGVEISIEETEQDCCAHAVGCFEDVVLDAAITHVGDIQYEAWEDGDTYGCSATVTIMHNRNLICKAVADADAGNGGYYYSIASFVVKIPTKGTKTCHFVGSDDGRDGE
jgi:hypothetical protein